MYLQEHVIKFGSVEIHNGLFLLGHLCLHKLGYNILNQSIFCKRCSQIYYFNVSKFADCFWFLEVLSFSFNATDLASLILTISTLVFVTNFRDAWKLCTPDIYPV